MSWFQTLYIAEGSTIPPPHSLISYQITATNRKQSPYTILVEHTSWITTDWGSQDIGWCWNLVISYWSLGWWWLSWIVRLLLINEKVEVGWWVAKKLDKMTGWEIAFIIYTCGWALDRFATTVSVLLRVGAELMIARTRLEDLCCKSLEWDRRSYHRVSS